MPIKKIWLVSREYDQLAGTGGVKDVCRQLAEALSRAKKKVSVVLPLYGFMDPHKLQFTRTEISFEIDMNYVGVERRESVIIWGKQINNVSVYLVEADRYREKKGIYTYTKEEEAENPLNLHGTAYNDYFAMNILLQKAALNLIIILGERPDIIHCQDAHTAILPALLRELEGFRHYFRNTGTLVTIHNAGHGYHQEVGDLPFVKEITGLPYKFILDTLLDGKFNPFLAAASYAIINTVSENYARELQETDDDIMTGWIGHRLLTRGVIIEGITNGINPENFSLGHTKFNAKHGSICSVMLDFKTGRTAGKTKCKEELLKAVRDKILPEIKQHGELEYTPSLPLLTMIGRLTSQKGIDILVSALEKLLKTETNLQILIQGVGDGVLEKNLAVLAETDFAKGKFCFLNGYDTELADRIYSAGDFFLIPSQYEPCGLTDFIAQLHGSLPIVHHVGGLVKVLDGITGFAYKDHSDEALNAAILRAIKIFRENPEKIKEMQQAAVHTISKYYTWDIVMEKYLKLYSASLNLSVGKERERLRAFGWEKVRTGNRFVN